MNEILEAVGDHPESALVVGPMRYGEEYYAAFLEAGGSAFFLAEGVDVDAYGLSNETTLQWVSMRRSFRSQWF